MLISQESKKDEGEANIEDLDLVNNGSDVMPLPGKPIGSLVNKSIIAVFLKEEPIVETPHIDFTMMETWRLLFDAADYTIEASKGLIAHPKKIWPSEEAMHQACS